MSNQPEEQSLMLGDRINWPYILGNGVLKFQDAVVKVEGEQSEQEVRESALALFNSIPEAWIIKDKQLREDLDNAIIKRKIDARKEFCGVKIGKPKIVEVSELQPYRLYHACVNVFHRRGLLSKTIFTEKIIPEPTDFEEEDTENKQATPNEEKTELEKLRKAIHGENQGHEE